MKKMTLIISLFMIFVSCGKSDEQTPKNKEEAIPFINIAREITFTTPDSLLLTARYTPSPDNRKAPLIAMIPMPGQTHECFQPFIDSLKHFFETDSSAADRIFPHLLSINLRGQGQSIIKGTDTLDYTKMSDEEYQKIPRDIGSLMDKVVKDYYDKIDTSQIYIIGASLGANAAIMATAFMPYISKLVLLSPGEDYHSLKPGEAFKKFNGNTFMAISRRDKYAYESVQRLIALKQKNWILKIYPREGQGTDILKYDIAMQEMIKWLFTD